MSSAYLMALAASALAAVVTTIGILVIRRFSVWGKNNAALFGSFAAGVLIAVSFLHVIPKAFSMCSRAPYWLLVGYGAMHLTSRFLSGRVCDQPQLAGRAFGMIALVGIGFHSFIDGVLYAVTFQAGVFTGTLAAVGMVLHELPEGIVTYALLRGSKMPDGRAVRLAFVAAALTTPLGTLASYPFVGQLEGEALCALLAASAGVLVYVGATHLLPYAEHECRRFSLLALLGGVLVAVLIVVTGH